MKMSLKGLAAGVLSVALAAGLVACGGNNTAATTDAATSATSAAADSTSKTKVVVFAAASMTESLTKAGDQFMAENPDVEITFNFDSSGTLKTQMEEGADCDVFISAGQKQMNQMDAAATKDHQEGLDLIASDTRFDILQNKVVLVVPEGNPKGIESFDQLAMMLQNERVLMAMGNSDVPVGQYTQKILAFYNLDETTLANDGKITYGTNVKEVTSQVSSGAVDCGVVYQSDATSAGLTIADTATDDMCGKVVYPAALTKQGEKNDAAKAFLEFLKGSEASKDFEEVGFTPLSK